MTGTYPAAPLRSHKMRSFSLFVAMFGVASAAPKGGPGTKKSGNMNGESARCTLIQ